jgi:hypothetical protein
VTFYNELTFPFTHKRTAPPLPPGFPKPDPNAKPVIAIAGKQDQNFYKIRYLLEDKVFGGNRYKRYPEAGSQYKEFIWYINVGAFDSGKETIVGNSVGFTIDPLYKDEAIINQMLEDLFLEIEFIPNKTNSHSPESSNIKAYEYGEYKCLVTQTEERKAVGKKSESEIAYKMTINFDISCGPGDLEEFESLEQIDLGV